MNSQHYEESMDLDPPLPASFGLQQNDIAMSDEYLQLLNSLDIADFLTSPSPNNGFSDFNALNDMEPNNMLQQFSPGNDQSPFMPMVGTPSPMAPQAVPVAPQAPQAYPVPTTSSQVVGEQSETMLSLDGIDPMRLGSSDMREMIRHDPSALDETLGSVEFVSSRQVSRGEQAQENAQIQPAPQPAQQSTAVQPAPDSRTVSRRPTRDGNQSRDGRRSRDGHHARDGNKTQRPSQSSPDSTSSTETKPYFSDFKFSELHLFKVNVRFMSTSVMSQIVTKPGGCLLHYLSPRQGDAIPPVGDQMERVPITMMITNRNEDGSVSQGEFPWFNDKQKRFTEKILTSFDRGLKLTSIDGDIYATRMSNTKLMWHSTQQAPGHAKDLERNKTTKVFDWAQFRNELATHYVMGTQDRVTLPAVWFSFGQKWDTESSKITTKLVWARIDPVRGCEMVKAANPNVEKISLAESMHSNSLAISNDSSNQGSGSI